MKRHHLIALAAATVLAPTATSSAWAQTAPVCEMSNSIVCSTGVDDSKWFSLIDYTDASIYADDACSDEIPIGFPFAFNGATYSTWRFNTNGQILLGEPNSPTYYTSSETDSALSIDICHADMRLNALDGNYVRHQLFGTAPSRTLVIEYCIRPFTVAGNWTVQVQLDEQGSITILYGSSALTEQPSPFLAGISHYHPANLADSNYAPLPLRKNLFYSINTADHACLYAEDAENTKWPGDYRYYSFTTTDTKCHVVDSLRLIAATPNSLTLRWNDSENDQADYSLWMKSPSSTTTVTSLTRIINGLQPDSTYYFAVTARCGNDTQSEPMKIRIHTPCLPVAETDLPYNLYSWGVNTHSLPPCWTLAYNTLDSYAFLYTPNYASIQMTTCMQLSTVRPYSDTILAILPQIGTSADLRRAIRFKAQSLNDYSTLEIGTISNITDRSTFTPAATYTVGTSLANGSYTYINENLGTSASDANIAIRITSTDPAENAILTIDSLSVYIPYNVLLTSNNDLWGTASYNGFHLSATPSTGYSFICWTDAHGTILSTSNPLPFTPTADTALIAIFDTTLYTVTTLVATGQETYGTVTPTHTALHFLADTLVATPAHGYRFSHWNNGSTSDTLRFLPTQDTQFVAYFTLDTFAVALRTNNPLWGNATFVDNREKWGNATTFFTPTLPYTGTDATLSPSGEATIFEGGFWWAPADDAEAYFTITSSLNPIARIIITLKDDGDTIGGPGWTLRHGQAIWNGNALAVNITACTAFVKQITIAYANSLLLNPTEDTAYLPYLATATATATAANHYHFLGWTSHSDTAIGTASETTKTFTIESDTTLLANFAPDTFNVALAVADGQSHMGSVAFSGTTLDTLRLPYLADTTLTATPAHGYRFLQWNDGNTTNPRTLTITSDTSLTASFTLDTFNVVLRTDTTRSHLTLLSPDRPIASPDTTLRLPYLTTLSLATTAINPCYSFAAWTSANPLDTLATTTTLTLAITSDTTLQAHFLANLYSADTTAIACDSFPWHGITYTATPTTAPTYTYHTAANGCDSIVSLLLTVNHSSSSTDLQTHCDTYTWRNGTTYTASTDTARYTLGGGNIYGCDSTITLHLTLHHSTTGAFTAQAEGSYLWLGETFTTSGQYTRTITNADGCDSTVTLTLAILPSSTPLPTIYSLLDRVLMVNHNPEGHTGINYHHYRWYKDGQLVKEGPDADSYDEGGAILEGCYHLEVSTSASDDYWVSSNELCFGTLGIDGADSELGFTLAPNPVAQGAQVVLAVEADEALLQKATLRIFDASGRVVLESRNGLQPTIEATFARGTYLVQVILTDGRKATRKLVVK